MQGSSIAAAEPGRATPVQELEDEDEDEEDVVSSSDEEDEVVFSANPVFMETYTLQELVASTPEGVKAYEKEKYLSDEGGFELETNSRVQHTPLIVAQ